MTDLSIIPRFGELLRALITATGYRPYFKEKGIDKDLDDAAKDERPGSTSLLLSKAASAWQEAICADCGKEWSAILASMLELSHFTLQKLAQNVDVTSIANDEGREQIFSLFLYPAVAGFLDTCNQVMEGPLSSDWVESPFAAWIDWASAHTGKETSDIEKNILSHLRAQENPDQDSDRRLLHRWKTGEPIGTKRLHYPYKAFVAATVGSTQTSPASRESMRAKTAWLVVCIGLQSLPLATRQTIYQKSKANRGQQGWFDTAVHRLTQDINAAEDRPYRRTAVELLTQTRKLLLEPSLDELRIQQALQQFQDLSATETEVRQRAAKIMHDWFSARFAARRGDKDAALQLYEAAVKGAWWRAGAVQRDILDEALKYAVGVGDEVAAKQYWDRTFVIGYNAGPKRELDPQESRKIATAFERTFHPLRAEKHWIPPMIQVTGHRFALTKTALSHPNRKEKHAEGRTRRTPFIDACREGSLSDVQALIEAGADLNFILPETGFGPLAQAMQRAAQSKDTTIIDYLLTREPRPETINRPFGVERQTPIKLAIELGRPEVLKRLVAMGGKIETECGGIESALCYALHRLYWALNPHDPAMFQSWLAGQGGATVYDAKFGVVLESDLSASRQARIAATQDTARTREIWRQLVEGATPSPVDSRLIIQTLLSLGADCNRKYRVKGEDRYCWTPTLLAAQIGDLPVFRALVDAGGDVNRALDESQGLERKNALWIAVNHKREAIAAFLKAQQRPR